MLALYEWLRDTALEALENVPPGPEAIADSVGPRSPSYQRDIAALYRQNADLETVRVKRGLWRDLLRTALGGIARSYCHAFKIRQKIGPRWPEFDRRYLVQPKASGCYFLRLDGTIMLESIWKS